ncbi:MAG: serine/threonine-protein phosphatase [Kofleriaceae bacterium]|nr:serine/threonine-protein phosphatase [Kofleriaceae bacterium]MCB9571033.1 serine/threonine-protein phosphatase [Kofleriaceae bacterium]
MPDSSVPPDASASPSAADAVPRPTLAVWGGSDIGCVREDNEDSLAIGDLDAGELWDGEATMGVRGARGLLVVVCDGMGGAQGGEVASDLAVRTVWAEMRQAQPTDELEVYARLLRRAVRAANRQVWDEAQREAALRGMGTTASALGFAGDHAVIAQVGDSRVYVFRAGVLVQVTRDQSLASALVHAGRASQSEVHHQLGAGAILQALGVAEDCEPSLSVVELRRGDRLLVCSDGLHGQLADGGIATVLDTLAEPHAAVDALIAAARAAGGNDNITAVVVDVGGDDLAPPASPEDLPRYTEIDPHEEGDRALYSTSYVARRLAARVGIGEDPGPPVVPATGQHAVLPVARTGPGGTIADVPGQARQRLRAGGVPLLAWVAILAIAAVLGWIAAGAW